MEPKKEKPDRVYPPHPFITDGEGVDAFRELTMRLDDDLERLAAMS